VNGPNLGFVANRHAESERNVIKPGDYIVFPKNSNLQRWLKKLTSKRARARRARVISTAALLTIGGRSIDLAPGQKSE